MLPIPVLRFSNLLFNLEYVPKCTMHKCTIQTCAGSSLTLPRLGNHSNSFTIRDSDVARQAPLAHRADPRQIPSRGDKNEDRQYYESLSHSRRLGTCLDCMLFWLSAERKHQQQRQEHQQYGRQGDVDHRRRTDNSRSAGT
jgi:hypothetical protein